MSESLQLFNDRQELEPICVVDADIRFMRSFYPPPISDRYYGILLDETPWRQDRIKIWGKEHLQPRLVAWHGDQGARYSYSGISMAQNPWAPTLLSIKSDIEAIAGVDFNSVLINLYRNQQDSVGWHSDDEPELGQNPVIASLSLGETRTFKLKHKTKKQEKPLAIDLVHGSLLLMAGTTQACWLHAIDKVRADKGPRINLTFRCIREIQSIKM
jgi:alkylated DNA repair dioxygenase AlkB